MRTNEAFTPPPEGGATGDVHNAYIRVWRHVKTSVEIYARQLTTDRDVRDDLIQEASQRLWMEEASRCDIRSREDLLYFKATLTDHMRKKAKSKGIAMDDASYRVPDDLRKQLS
ncbi:MAG: hypothetical protein V4550_08930 [Gemmatimonadota bacterium]